MQGDNHPAKRALLDAREHAVAKLAECFARDELSLEDFERRVVAAYASESAVELERLVADLSGTAAPESVLAIALHTGPNSLPARDEAPVSPQPHAGVTAILGHVARQGSWEVRDGTRLLAVLGNLELDLRESPLPSGVTEIHVRAVLGNVEVVVPADVAVECDGTGILGSFETDVRASRTLAPDAPRLRIVGSAILGSISILARPPARVELLVRQLRHGPRALNPGPGGS